MYGEGEFDDSGGLGLLLGAAQAETDVLHEAAAPSPAAAPLPAPANAPVGATGSLEPATGLDQEQLDSQEGDEQPASASLNPLKLEKMAHMATIGGRGQAERQGQHRSLRVQNLIQKPKQRTTKHPKPQRFGTLRHIAKRKVPTTILTRYRVKSG